jgi:hypothetical protein
MLLQTSTYESLRYMVAHETAPRKVSAENEFVLASSGTMMWLEELPISYCLSTVMLVCVVESQ